MRNLANRVVEVVLADGAKEALFVGGCVRDFILGIPAKDYDVEVYGLDLDRLVSILSQRFKNVKVVGESFGVIKVENQIDVSVPRRENKMGVGHKGFNVTLDPNMTPFEAAARRDFTINSMMMKRDGEIIDPYDGVNDLHERILRHTSDAFREDPLRVLRGMQFAGRFGMNMAWETAEVCQSMVGEHSDLAKERIFEEWWKWATKSEKPSRGLDVLFDTGWLDLYSEITVLCDVPQDPEWHPEGNVYNHTRWVCDAAAWIATRENLSEQDRGILMFSALCHDFGKYTTTDKTMNGERLPLPDGQQFVLELPIWRQFPEGYDVPGYRWTAHGHDQAGVEPTKAFLDNIGAPNELKEHIPPLVAEHMAHASFAEGEKVSLRTIRRLANRLAPSNIKMWGHLCEADHSGRPPLPVGNPVAHWIETANDLNVLSNKPKGLVMGRHLIELGVKPGPEMGKITKAAFEAQLDGVFDSVEGGLEWCRTNGLIK